MPERSSKLRSGQLNQAIYSDTKVRLIADTERERLQMGEVKYKGSIPPQPPLTKERFMGLLTKSAQPLKLDSKVKRTSVSHLSDGYSYSIDWQIQAENIFAVKIVK